MWLHVVTLHDLTLVASVFFGNTGARICLFAHYVVMQRLALSAKTMPELRYLSLDCQPVNGVKVTVVNQIVVDDAIRNSYAVLVHQPPLTQSTLWRLD